MLARRARGSRGNPLAVALRRFLKANADDIGQDRSGWFLVARRGRSVQFLSGRPFVGDSPYVTCQGVPPTKVTLVLEEPLNGRALRDAGPYPARPR
ncbi:MAG: hypothetical protein WKF29_07910 [Thermoleophilaceae bacterium]